MSPTVAGADRITRKAFLFAAFEDSPLRFICIKL